MSLADVIRDTAKKAAQPAWTEPMLATLTYRSFSDSGWVFEQKFDGERCLARKDAKGVRLFSRNRTPLNNTYPELVEPLERQPAASFVIDGEIVAFEDGRVNFARLKRRMHVTDPTKARNSGIAVVYYIFDLVWLEGYDFTEVPLRARKSLLKQSFDFHGPLRYTVHRNEKGEDLFRIACRKGWEGVIAKDAGSPYVHGRSRRWLKFKCGMEQEFVIAGYTKPKGGRVGFGALLLGYYEGSELVYAGRVGTGFADAALGRLHQMLSALQQSISPFASASVPERDVHWVRPELVCRVGFTEWTDDQRLRHPRFLGLRAGGIPGEVVRRPPGTL